MTASSESLDRIKERCMRHLGQVSTETMAKDFGSPWDGMKTRNMWGVLCELGTNPGMYDEIENPY
jgi:hypothetical protein